MRSAMNACPRSLLFLFASFICIPAFGVDTWYIDHRAIGVAAASADFDGDGELDVAVVHQRTSGVTIHLGNGDGTFDPPTAVSDSSEGTAIAAGHLNGDSHVDLAILTGGFSDLSARLRILLGNGDGTFTSSLAHSFFNAPQYALAIGRFNADAYDDIIAFGSIFLGNGDGTFGSPASLGAADLPWAVAAADVDDDGKLDVVAAQRNANSVAVIRGNGDGTFQMPSTYAAGSSPVSVAVADLDGDDQLDIAVANQNVNGASSTASVLGGNGDGTFGSAQPYVVKGSAESVEAADVSGDGAPDLLVASWLGTTSILISQNGGPLTLRSVAGHGARDVVAGDWNGDSKVDLAIAGAEVSFHLGHGNGSFGQARGDFTGDVRSDVLWSHPSGEHVLWAMNGTSLAAASYLPGTFVNWNVAGEGDFDADGHRDLIWLHEITRQVVVWMMTRSTIREGVFLPSAPSGWTIAAVGDFNLDFKSDVLLHNASTGDATVWIMNGASIERSMSLGPIADPAYTVAGVADVDGDGAADIVWHKPATGATAVWLISGQRANSGALASVRIKGSTQPGVVADTSNVIAGVADFDGDGVSDVIWRNSATGDVVIWFMSAGLIRSASLIATVNSADWEIEGIGDFDHDGRSDLMWRNTSNGDVVAWLIDSSLKQAASITRVNNTEWSISAPQ